jgi:hypothetical protein
MIARKKEFTIGIAMLVSFFVVLFIFFSPVFNGQNGLDYLDSLYNSISKGSVYYISKVRDEAKPLNGTAVEASFRMAGPEQAQQTAALFMKAGAMVNVSDATVKVSGDLGRILDSALSDADAMYFNDGKKVADRYGYSERQALYNWWQAFKGMERDLLSQKKFQEAKTIATVSKKALETSYNYYGIQAQKIMERLGLVVFSLLFYVVYTMWYGFGILFIFEGFGLQIDH